MLPSGSYGCSRLVVCLEHPNTPRWIIDKIYLPCSTVKKKSFFFLKNLCRSGGVDAQLAGCGLGWQDEALFWRGDLGRPPILDEFRYSHLHLSKNMLKLFGPEFFVLVKWYCNCSPVRVFINKMRSLACSSQSKTLIAKKTEDIFVFQSG